MPAHCLVVWYNTRCPVCDAGIDRQRGKLLARERVELLLDPDSPFLELSPLAAWGTNYTVGASLVTGIGVVEGTEVLVTANDPTVRGGATNPYGAKKGGRAAQIAEENRLPVVSLVESGGADLKKIMLEQSTLTVKGKEPLHPADVQVNVAPTGIEAYVLFPRSTVFSVDDKELEFASKVARVTIKYKFRLKDMMYSNKLEM